MRGVALSWVFLLASIAPAVAQEGAHARAQAVYAANCAICHAPAPGAPVGDLARRAPAAYDAFVAAVRNGESPSGEMPAFAANVVSDADLAALHAYITRVRAGR